MKALVDRGKAVVIVGPIPEVSFDVMGLMARHVAWGDPLPPEQTVQHFVQREKRVLPAAAEVGAAVLTDLPFGRNEVFRAVRGKSVPDWAKEFAGDSWGQFFLKYLIANTTITAVIPGTSNPAHMADNLGAGRGRLPDAAERRRMVQFFEALG